MQTDKLRKRKGVIIVSLFILAVAFASAWLIIRLVPGGAGTKSDQRQAFNTQLPDANLKESGRNKLEIYMQAEKDSAKLKELQQKDASHKKWFDPLPPENDDEVFANEYTPKTGIVQAPSSKKYADPNERKVNDRLGKLYAAINNNGNEQTALSTRQTPPDINKYDNNIAQLETLLQQMQRPSADTNPEIKQIESVLDKVLDIQHPERMDNRFTNSGTAQRGTIFTVTTSENTGYEDSVIQQSGGNAFFGFQNETEISSSQDLTTISAVVHQDQLLQDASVIKLRLLQDIFIKGKRIPSGTFIFGECSLGDQRLEIRFNSITYNSIIYPVQLTAFDTDGNQGIYIPGAIGRDETKNGVDRAIQQMQLATLNPSLGAQAASAGIQTAQNLLSKKVKRVQVTVKAGHRVLLKSGQLN